ncbi:hypothetical protein OROGR_017304 [Orobanche gracilis]
MAPLEDYGPKKLLLFLIPFSLLFLTLSFISVYHQNQPKGLHLFSRSRILLQLDENEDGPIITKKKKSTSSTKNSTITTPKNNQTKQIIKPTSNPSKNQTKPMKISISSKNNETKPIKTSPPATIKSSQRFTEKPSFSSDLTSSKNKTTKPNPSKETEAQLGITQPKSKKVHKKQPSWIDDEDDDLIAGFRDLPSKFQENIVPDLAKISKTSQIYFTNYNKEFTNGFKPYFGNKYASTIASLVSFAFILIPLIIVSLIFHRIKAYFSLQKLLIFIQVYLAIYFTILCLSSLATGLEPLRFFYSTSRSTYICVQVLQTLAYVLYLLILLMYLILVFSTETGLATKLLGLAQTFVGFAVGLHYYTTVFHRAVLHQPPKSGWKVHAIYATCFLVICLLGRADRRKKAYLEEGGEEGKRS